MPSSGNSGTVALPDLTRSLRHLGSASASLRGAHDRWFQPLLQARPLTDAPPAALAAAWNARAVHSAWERMFEELGAVHGTASPAHARAMEARLEQCAARAVALLAESARRAEAVVDAGDVVARGSGSTHTANAAWRDWMECLRQLFRAADEAWGCMERTLGTSS